MQLIGAVFLIFLIGGIEGNKMKPMTGVHLVVAVNHEPPIFSIIKDANGSVIRYVGFPKDAFDTFSASLNFTYSFLEVTPSMVKEAGSIDGALIDQLVQKKADFNGRLTSPKAERIAIIDYTKTIAVLDFAFIQPMPEISNRFLATLKPFQLTVWCLILVAFGATAIALTVLTISGRSFGFNGHNQTGTRTLKDNGWYAFNVLMAQGPHFPSNSLPLRIVAGSWCLIAVVIFYAYNSTLISYISLPVYDPIINNWEELAASKTLRVASPKGGVFVPALLNAKTGPMKVLGDSLRRNPGDLILGLPGEMDAIFKSRCCAYVEVKRLLEILVYRNMVANGGECQLTIGKGLDFSQTWTFSATKNSPYLHLINKEIERLTENNIMSRLGKGYSKSIGKCLAKSVDRSKKSKLNLYDLASAFFVLGLGTSVSFLVFLIELILASRRKFNSAHLPRNRSTVN